MKFAKYITMLLFICNISLVSALQTIIIGASPVPHADILKFIQPLLAKDGYQLKIVEFSDYVTPNMALASGKIAANFFQHQPFLTQYNLAHNSTLVALTPVHLEPMGLYANSKTQTAFIKSKQVAAIVPSSSIGIPNDSTNEGRALGILAAHHIISIDSKIAFPTKKNITSNPYKLKFIELDAAMLPRALIGKQLDLALINANFALQAGLQPLQDAVITESNDSKFANIIAIRSTDVHSPAMVALKKAAQSAELKNFIKQHYSAGGIIPAL